ncbi:MAG: alpha-galactosidase, partial [Lentisphaeria bacterium]|nr:alpha-galactosidase [Lentisphaeria bacterium]
MRYPFENVKIGWLDFANAQTEISADEKKLVPVWEKRGDDQYSAKLDFGTLNLRIVSFSNGIRIESSLDLTGALPENVVFTPLLIPETEADHVFFCGEKMGRCSNAELPVKEARSFNGRYYSALTRDHETVILTAPLAQQYDNYCRGAADGGKILGWRIDFELHHFDPAGRIVFDPVTVQCGDGIEILERYAADNTEVKRDFSVPPEYGWNSWDYYRWTITEDEVMKNAEFIAADPVLKQHVKRIIVDDGWQYCYGEWDANPNFPSGMKKLADRIRKLGFKPGLWLAPSIVEPHCRIAQMDYDMLACSEGGQPCLGFKCVGRYGFLLDPTVPKSQKFLTD